MEGSSTFVILCLMLAHEDKVLFHFILVKSFQIIKTWMFMEQVLGG